MSASLTSRDRDDPHLDNGALLALLDASSEAPQAREARALEAARDHVAHCAACDARLQALSTDAARVRASIALIDTPRLEREEFLRRVSMMQRSSRRSTWSRAAVAGLLAASVVGVAASASTVLRWIGRSPARTTAANTVQAADAPTVSRAGASTGATVSFEVSDSMLTVQFDARPADGELRIEREAGARASVRVVDGAEGASEGMLVLPNALRLHNSVHSRGNYVLAVPHSVVRVRVAVAGDTVFDAPPPARVALSPDLGKR